ncbi:MAG: bifunctional riboflavin kinase/FAD synthetase [Deltaproteobacteria bacterium]|nr:bifunctional riboflavin kinase/FAD synthetase [Deltaproteobacteria bacterium]MBW1923319.1 bifunctional riboflavin kinase/FAD synthetase [Deltaproteobacteria bacterium]MBW1949972.1 bifunctional riboflavin kinase/FAD synthetase [Deltaproteobacteria bacterium]MBW2007918.1 bifunctional riboflavin kinase/FAD synthetase [Deltaproteobacteria bacterium]MBW2101892.1 bifunctional riboflavin kinase/FAD synthetase [Deltaproteobacteria bacterium]
MTIIRDLSQIREPLVNPVLTIGNFDGVHHGHLALFARVKERARALNGQSAVMTFDPHPMKIMNPDLAPPIITPTSQKIQLIDDAGIDVIFCLPFTREFAAVTAEDFIHEILVKRIGIREIVVGYDYSFGRDRRGDIDLLRKMGETLGYRVHVVDPIRIDTTLVSSTSIRELVREGALSGAKKLLGRDYQITGTVVKGRNRGGRLLGFPTANLDLLDELTPKPGVYAVNVVIDGVLHPGVTNIGYNPTFGEGNFSVETHILDFSGDLLGKTIQVRFLFRLRDEKTFDSIEALADQIGKDILRARELLGSPRDH